jgi:Zn-dependent membrane protease YugP
MYWYYNMGDYSFIFYILAFGIMIWSLIVRTRLNSLVKKYSNVPVASGKDANTCVHEMLAANEVYGVTVKATGGEMTDNYNPKEETINLSETTYGRNSITAVAVAAHECGHACQAHSSMALYKVRQAIAPVASITSKISVWIAIIGVFIMYASKSLEMNQMGYTISTIGIVLYSVVFIFYLVTLPIERDASRRGLKAMKEFGWVSDDQYKAARSVLWAAGDTYAVALASAALTLLRLLLMRGRRRR